MLLCFEISKPSHCVNSRGYGRNLPERIDMHTIPHTSGIYQILCVPTGKIYIGSSNDMARRWSEHRKMLRSGIHPNAHLQGAWNKYTEAAFTPSVVEQVERDLLSEHEQFWIDQKQTSDRRHGFNLSPSAKFNYGYRHTKAARIAMARGHAKRWDGFITPEGEIVSIVDLKQFCQQYDLDVGSMSSMAYGEPYQLSHKGWSHVNAAKPRQKYKDLRWFIRPDGTREPQPASVQEFCQQYDLNWKAVYKLIKGEYKTHKGWRYEPDHEECHA